MSDVNLWGDTITERQARQILPILVRQALAGQPITYGHISDELSIGHSYLGNHLGIISDALNALARQWGEEIPPIQALVVYKQTGLPGDRLDYGVPRLADYASLPPSEKVQTISREHAGIFAYDKWPAALAALNLPPAQPAVPPALVDAARGGVGEGEAHRRLKEYVAANPDQIELPRSVAPGTVEYLLPSTDAIDVLFEHKNKHERVAVEVKAASAGTADILRGLFQCVKYEALLAAEQAVTGEPAGSRAVLVLEGKLPDELVAARNTLGITVFERVSPVS